jgi:hypothetical protein
MLLVCISIYLKSLLKYKFLILGTQRPDTLYLCEQGCEYTWLFLEAKRGPRATKLGKHCISDSELAIRFSMSGLKLRVEYVLKSSGSCNY